MLASIITCAFNQREEYFRQCAQSVARQTDDIEWIVVDDGSCLDGKRVHQRVIDEVSPCTQIDFVELPKSVGLSAARNCALKQARGCWIVVLDSDDLLAPNIISALGTLPDHTEVACVEVNYFSKCVTEHRRVAIYEMLFRKYGKTVRDPFLWFDFYYHGVMARRNLLERIDGYDLTLCIGEDQDILFRATEAVGVDQVSFLHQVGYEYRNNPDGVCNTRWDDVAFNYTHTMLEAANRRGGDFVRCQMAETRIIDGAKVDCYSYQSTAGKWLTWRDCYRNELIT